MSLLAITLTLTGFYSYTPILFIFGVYLEDIILLEAYRKHVAERAAQNIPPKALNAEQVAGLVELSC
jgi:hypothetical protein